MSKLEEIKKLRETVEAEKKVLNKKCKESFTEVVKEIFTTYPKLKSFAWRQYTPYFNDGEPCEFSVHSDSDCISIDGADYYDYPNPEDTELTEEEVNVVASAVEELLNAIGEDTLEEMFGSDSEILVKKEDGEIIIEDDYYGGHD